MMAPFRRQAGHGPAMIMIVGIEPMHRIRKG
jgi:hypothetical protein